MTSDAIIGAVVAIEIAWLGALTALSLNRRMRSIALIVISTLVFAVAYLSMLAWNSAVQHTYFAVADILPRPTAAPITNAVEALYFGPELIIASAVGLLYCCLLPKIADYVNPDRNAGDLH